MSIVQTSKNLLCSFQSNLNGNVAMAFAVIAPAALLAMGVAIDYSSAVNQQEKLQASLDASILAMSVKISQSSPNEFSNNKGKKEIRKIFDSESNVGKIKSFSVNSDAQSIEVAATAQYRMKTNFGGIIGKRNILVKAASVAKGPMALSSFKIRVTKAHGWWNKTAKIIGEKDGVQTVLTTATYAYDRPSLSSTFKADNSKWIDIRAYDDVFILFTVDGNSFGTKEMCGHPTTCPDRIVSTRDPEEADNLYLDGVRQKKGTKIKFENLVDCKSRSEHGWEDGGGGSGDFFYEIEGKCEFSNPFDIYISQ